MRKKNKILLSVFIFTAYSLFSTVDYLAINKITKEFAVIEDNEYQGLGWKSAGFISDEKWDYYTKEFLPNMGYKEAKFRYKIEAVISILAILSITIIVRNNYKRFKK